MRERSDIMKITEMNNCIEKMRECYKFDDDKTEITLGDSTSSSTRHVNVYTKDESPMAYKTMDEIIGNIKDTVEIVDITKPIYNFKANE